ncbi:MAG TPA: ribonuclease P protein subunit [Euryarchaeota archaeon]|nr:ribonuclease P protein subunit [Euryarchaeota archaeon]
MNVNKRKIKWLKRSALKHEIIGKRIEVIDSSCPHYVGIKGIVIDETKNTLKIRCEDGHDRIVPKRSCKFRMWINDEVFVEFNGIEINYRPHERITKSRWV